MNLLKFLPLGWQLGIYAVVIGAIIAGGSVAIGSFIHHERMIGWNGALAQVAKRDAHAKAIADQAGRDVDECERGGGEYDVSTGDCIK